VLEKRGIIRSATSRLKVIGGGELATAISVRAHGFSKSAKQKIEAAGGKVDVIVIPRRPKRLKKKAERKS
jgi:large subunit ribosomal protein L15